MIGGGNNIHADNLSFNQSHIEPGDCQRCEWVGNSTSSSFGPCGAFTGSPSFFVVFRLLWPGIAFDSCTAEVEIWDSSARTTMYAHLWRAGTRCCAAFAGKAFTALYDAFPCGVPSTVTLATDIADLVECGNPCCGENPPCTSTSTVPPLSGCCCDPAPDLLSVDFGAGGLTADDCTGSGCGDIRAVFDLSPTFDFGASGCQWSILLEGWCEAGGSCGVAAGCFDSFDLVIEAFLTRDGDECRLDVYVHWGPEAVSDDCSCDLGSGAQYSIAGLDCDAASWTLSKVAEDWGQTCAGSLPSTITVTPS